MSLDWAWITRNLPMIGSLTAQHAVLAVLPVLAALVVSIPLGFLFGIIGALSSREPAAEDRYTELEVRALTGAGSEKAISH